MAAAPNFTPFDRLKVRLGRLVNPTPGDVQELALEVAAVMVEDNRAGVLSGVDKNGTPAPALRYRGGSGTPTAFRAGSDPTFGLAARLTKTGRRQRIRFKGLSTFQKMDMRFRQFVLPNNNLPTWRYQQLTGPRLAPRGEESRSISNYKPLNPPGVWSNGKLVVTCAWVDIVSAKGKPFFRAHLKGANGLPKYDLAGVRPNGKRLARLAARDWARNLLGVR